jgi:hypothetical protein
MSSVRESYFPLVERGLAPAANLPPPCGSQTILGLNGPSRCVGSLKRRHPNLVITLGKEPLQCLGLEPLDASTYGEAKNAGLLGLKARLLPRVHPRQSGGLGKSSPKWTEAHSQLGGAKGPGLAGHRDCRRASLLAKVLK